MEAPGSNKEQDPFCWTESPFLPLSYFYGFQTGKEQQLGDGRCNYSSLATSSFRCEIFTVGGFPLNSVVRRAFVAIHLASIVATTWILMMNGAVGYQVLDDGTFVSLGLIFGSAAVLFIGTGYIALDTGFSWTGFFDSTLSDPNRSYSLYTLYQLVPLIFLVIFFLLEANLVIRVLGEKRPMLYLFAAALLFAIGQVFQYVVSVHICNGVNGKINGGLFEVLFTLLSVILVWLFWSSITEDDWQPPPAGTGTYT